MGWKNISELIGIGERIQNKREEIGFSQRELANLTKIGLRTIQKYENNEVNPKVETLQKIADVLNTDVEEFVLGQTKDSIKDLAIHYFLTGIKHPKTFLNKISDGIVTSNSLYEEILEAKQFIDEIENASLRNYIAFMLIDAIKDWNDFSKKYINYPLETLIKHQLLEKFIDDSEEVTVLKGKLTKLEEEKKYLEEQIEKINKKIFNIYETRYFSENNLLDRED